MKLYYFETLFYPSNKDYNCGYILDTGYGFIDLEVNSIFKTMEDLKFYAGE